MDYSITLEALIDKKRIQQQLNSTPFKIQVVADTDALKGVGRQATGAGDSFKKLGSEVTSTNKALNQNADSLGRVISKFSKWVVVGSLIYVPINQMKKALTTIKEVDSELSEIAKVLNTTIEKIQYLGDESYKIANRFGATAKGYLEGVADFSRAGYGKMAEGLSEVSLLAQTAGDMSAELADDWILAADSAYKLGGNTEKLIAILDLSNQMTNRNAVTMGDLANGFKILGSQASQMGLSVEETNAAIGTVVATTRRSAAESARGIKGILMNLQAVKGTIDEETGEIVDTESISKANKALESVKISTMELKDGLLELRDPMKVLAETAGKWETLSSVQQSQLTEALGGKYRSNQFVALMENWDLYEKMLQDQTNATGSAMAEVEVFASSLEGRLNKLNNTWADFFNRTVDANILKGLVSGGTETLDFLGDLDNVVLLLSGSFLALKREKIASEVLALKDNFAGLIKPATAAATAVEGVGTASTAAATGLSRALGVVGLAIAAFSIVEMAFSKFEKEQESLGGSLEVTTKKYKELKDEVNSSNKSFRDNISETETQAKTAENYADKLDELSKKTSLTSYEQEQMKLAVSGLNSIIPDLNLSIDATTGKLSMQYDELLNNIDGFKKLSLAQAYQSIVGEKSKQAAEAQLSMEATEAERDQYNLNTIDPNDPVKGMEQAYGNYKFNRLTCDIEKKAALVQRLQKEVDSATKKYQEYSDGLRTAIGSTGDTGSDAGTDVWSEDVLGGGSTEKEDVLAVFNEIKRIYEQKIDLSEQVQQKYGEETAEFKKQADLQEDYHSKIQLFAKAEADKLRAQGYTDETEEIAELQDAWWESAQWKIDKKKEALEKQKELEEQYLSEIKALIEENLSDEKAAMDKKIERYDAQITKANALLTLENAHYSLLKSISSAQKDIDTQLEIAKESYEYLDEETRKMLFNEEDYDTLSSKLSEIAAEADELYENYQDDISDLTSENIYLAEEITAEYERQYELKKLEYEIAEKEVALTKVQTELSNVESNRNTLMLVNGKYQWVADPDAVKEALEAVAEAEEDYAESVADLEQEKKTQELEETISELETKKAEVNAEYEAMEETWAKMQESLETPVTDITTILTDIAENATPALKETIENVASYLATLTGTSTSKIKSTVSSSSSSSGNTVYADSEGNAPSGTTVGDTVITNNGNDAWEVVGEGDTTDTTGGNYNSATNLTSKQLYDEGGIAKGKGVMVKGTDEDELVLGPQIMSKAINPLRNKEFTDFTGNISDLIDAATKYSNGGFSDSVGSSSNDVISNINTSTVDSHDSPMYVNGVKVEGEKATNLAKAFKAIVPIHNNKK